MSRPKLSARTASSPKPSLTSRTASSPKPSLMNRKNNPRSTVRRSHTRDTRSKETVKYNMASDQRAVFDWYEKYQYKDDAGDIFSPEWQCRLTDWTVEFDLDIADVHSKVAEHKQQPEDLQLGVFFLAYPVAAFSLWHVLQACYELDKCICGTSVQERNEITEWRNWRPFQYLLSQSIMSNWKGNLVSLSSEVEQSTNKFQKENIASRLYTMAEGVQVLEEAISILVSVFERQHTNMPCSSWMLDLIREGVDNRCRAIENHITYYKTAA